VGVADTKTVILVIWIQIFWALHAYVFIIINYNANIRFFPWSRLKVTLNGPLNNYIFRKCSLAYWGFLSKLTMPKRCTKNIGANFEKWLILEDFQGDF
jgi:hypothetical protein